MNVRGVDFVQFAVSDFGKSVSFYRDTLGLELEFCNEEWKWAEFSIGNLTVAFYGTGESVKVGDGGLIALAVDDLDAALEELREAGVSAHQGPVSGEWCSQFTVLDPDGYQVMIHRRKDGTFGQNA